VVGLLLLGYPLRHEPVQRAHVEVNRREPHRVPLEALEAEPWPELVEADEGLIVEPNLELFTPEPGPPSVGVCLLESLGVKPPQGVWYEGPQLLRRGCAGSLIKPRHKPWGEGGVKEQRNHNDTFKYLNVNNEYEHI